ncbi:MAG: glycerate kinase [Lachnospiraceae bacterium]|nr:glycerate kinase [Lachnospiraceae bacterium]
MKIVIAIDSFKGSMTSMEAGFAAKEGILRSKPEAEVIVMPLADGGEGTTDALIEGLGGEKINLTVTGPLHKPINTYYGYLKESNTAVMEMAGAAGIILLSEEEKDPFQTTTYGVGEMIKDAVHKGIRNFIIGIGGSATNDGGIGMLKALGYTFFDKDGNDVGEGGQALAKIALIKTDQALTALTDCHFKIACDVNNPLCGPNGATYIYGPQKGVTDETKDILDTGMGTYADAVAATIGKDNRTTAGVGAAGGLGFAFLNFLNGELIPGIELILDAIKLEDFLPHSDFVITGEGRLDHQTAMGKVPVGVAKLAKRYNARVLAFAGGITKDAGACNNAGIDAFFPIVRGVTTLEEAMKPEHAKENMAAAVEQVFRLF